MQEFTRAFGKVAGLLAILGTIGIFASAPVCAQEFDAPKVERTYSNPNLPQSIKSQMKPGRRYTVGSQEQVGWHHGLVKSNKNLGHYFWASMSNMTQASCSDKTKRQARQAQIARQRKNYHYVKPGHVPLPKNPNVKLPTRRHTSSATKIGYRHTKKKVAAKVRFPRSPRSKSNVNGRLISKQTGAKVYANYNKYSSSKAASGYLASKNAYGKLLTD